VYNIPQTSSPPPLYFSPPSLPLFQTVFGGFHYAVFIYVYVTYFHLLYTKELIKMFNKYLLNLNTLLNLKKKKVRTARHQWLTPVILATREAEIRRMAVQRQPELIFA
jgi:hypothetical protein